MRLTLIRMPEGTASVALDEKPTRVWSLPDSESAPSVGGFGSEAHLDEGHDWNWRSGRLRYSVSGRPAAWLVVLHGSFDVRCPCGESTEPHWKFCPVCGERITYVFDEVVW